MSARLRTAILLSLVLITEVLICYGVIQFFTLRSITSDLKKLTSRVSQELTYKNGSWDTSQYTSDPLTPHPSGSSGFSTPLYIIASDGFVIERNSPIPGLLDSSDFNHLIAFTTPQTLKIVSNEQWRIASEPIKDNAKTVGVIVVSLYNPDKFIQSGVDEKLKKNIDYIKSKVVVSNGDIVIKDIDIRNIDYDISFEVVNSFNKVLLNNGRMPSYIDKSYVYNELKAKNRERFIIDSTTHKTYKIVSETIQDNAGNTVGLVIAGENTSFITDIFYQSLPFILIFSLILFAICFVILDIYNSHQLENALNEYEKQKNTKTIPGHIMFNKKTSKLHIDSNVIDIPYASNQYYLCKTIFSDVKKRWEVDEILEAFGHDTAPENWRKVYDSMILINKKTDLYIPVKLIELKDKTYQLNPQLLTSTS